MFFLVFFLGLIFGSFIAALTWRYAKGISIAKGRSICPKCKHQISWYDNIPLLSYIILAGKCRNCKKKISLRYPIIELATAIGFVATSYFATTFKGSSLQGVVISLILFCILEIIFIIDLENQIIPDEFIFIGIVVIIFNLQFTIYNSLLAGLVCATFLLIIHIATKGQGMGLGDVKFAVLGSLIVGPRLSVVWLFTAFLTGAVVGIILILGRKAGLKSKIAFGPFLVIAIPITLIWGEKLINIMGLP